MSKLLELPDELYERLERAAADAGKTPIDFIADATARANGSVGPPPSEKSETLRERFEGLIGGFHSGGRERLSENCGEKFTDHLEQKRREGRL